jgi:hypothetical protein
MKNPYLREAETKEIVALSNTFGIPTSNTKALRDF